MNSSISYENRLAWVDWMKTIAMYFIIVGHMFLPGNEYIYVFSVPCFFIISGFLSRKEENEIVFWQKIWWNLIVPMYLLFIIKHTEYFAKLIHSGSFQLSYLWQAPLLAIGGMQGEQFAAGGLVSLWFVYTLVLCKILLQYIPKKGFPYSLFCLNILFLILAIVIKQKGGFYYSSIVDVVLAMPFFTIGFALKSYKVILSKVKHSVLILVTIVGGVGIWFCGSYNDLVMLYRNDYGSNLLLCIVGGVAGTAVIYSISLLLDRCYSEIVSIIGGGTLIILALHPIVIHLFGSIKNLIGIENTNVLWAYVEALLILLIFIPVIQIIKHYFPLIYGKYRIGK